MTFLGIDIGTSGVKALLIVQSVKRQLPLLSRRAHIPVGQSKIRRIGGPLPLALLISFMPRIRRLSQHSRGSGFRATCMAQRC